MDSIVAPSNCEICVLNGRLFAVHLKRKKLSVVFLLVSHEDNETICRLLLLQHETESILLAWATSADALAFLNSSGAADVPAFSSSSSLSSSELPASTALILPWKHVSLSRQFHVWTISIFVNCSYSLHNTSSIITSLCENKTEIGRRK